MIFIPCKTHGHKPEPVSLANWKYRRPELEFLKRIKKTFEVGCLRHNKLLGREIQTVALCGGAGAFLMPLAIRNRADVFITGEIKYHDYFGHDTDILLD